MSSTKENNDMQKHGYQAAIRRLNDLLDNKSDLDR